MELLDQEEENLYERSRLIERSVHDNLIYLLRGARCFLHTNRAVMHHDYGKINSDGLKFRMVHWDT